jgi:hypothetical protein
VSRIILYILINFTLLLSTGARNDEITTFRTIPPPEYHKPGKNNNQLYNELDIPIYSYNKIVAFDKEYIGITFDYFKQYNAWWWKIRYGYLSTINTPAFDCDNYAFLYKTMLTTAATLNPRSKQILVGVIIVEQKNSTLGLPAIKNSTKHALCIVYTSSGWFVIEPQTNKYTPLTDYKNTIHKYIF